MEMETPSKKIGLPQKPSFKKQNKEKDVVYEENPDFTGENSYHKQKKGKNDKGEPFRLTKSKFNVSLTKNVVKKSKNKKAKKVVKVIIKKFIFLKCLLIFSCV